MNSPPILEPILVAGLNRMFTGGIWILKSPWPCEFPRGNRQQPFVELATCRAQGSKASQSGHPLSAARPFFGAGGGGGRKWLAFLSLWFPLKATKTRNTPTKTDAAIIPIEEPDSDLMMIECHLHRAFVDKHSLQSC